MQKLGNEAKQCSEIKGGFGYLIRALKVLPFYCIRRSLLDWKKRSASLPLCITHDTPKSSKSFEQKKKKNP
jgi:hypothetical protein